MAAPPQRKEKPGKGSREKPRFFPVDLPPANQANRIIFAAACTWRKCLDPAPLRSSPDIVIREALPELGDVSGLVLGLVQAGYCGVQGGTGHQILLPGDLIGGMSLGLGAGAKAHAGDAISALDGHAVGGEGPLVGEGTALPQDMASRFWSASAWPMRLSPHRAW